ncbi:hypothetical protein NBRC116601_15440 [Cognatishimia sp. WU-CL00825]|uniref:DUF1800 domain-containing protein n=1 Tax=Cognatishimia sp. WU-CL00825 TaxID=3127658 RepID=UPI00310448F2
MFDPHIAEIRFGTGLSPTAQPPQSIQDMLNGLTSPDHMATRFPIEPYDQFRHRVAAFNDVRRTERKNRGTELAERMAKERKSLVKDARTTYATTFRNALLRRVHSETGLRERLAFFWADHFTAHGKVMIVKWATSPYVQEAIRPNITGTFADLLISAVTHPLMLNYLDQQQSVGPNSKRATPKNQRGLNENLAREVLELHTLGVDGPYSQADVRQLAELFTGMGYDRAGAFKFDPRAVEPGHETVLGKSYGSNGGLRDIQAALRDLANHPVTAKHIATKLVRHFISDQPDPDQVKAVETAFLQTGGDLMALYQAMLDHPASWTTTAQNVKLPIDFIASALRALDIGEPYLTRSREKDLRNILYIPLQIMGQPWEKPNGPDGWPEENSHWITPQFMAARLQWALAAPQALRRTLPDPRTFASAALGNRLTQEIRFAAEAAENRWEGIALVLSSPAFQRQ